MKNVLRAVFILLLIPFSAYAQLNGDLTQNQCAEGQIYGCGSFTTQVLPTIQRTICGCFDAPDEPVGRPTGLRSCARECPLHSGVRTDAGCECLKGSMVIPERAPPALPAKELTALYKLKQKNPELYQVYIDTQLTGNELRPPMPVEKFIDLSN